MKRHFITVLVLIIKFIKTTEIKVKCRNYNYSKIIYLIQNFVNIASYYILQGCIRYLHKNVTINWLSVTGLLHEICKQAEMMSQVMPVPSSNIISNYAENRLHTETILCLTQSCASRLVQSWLLGTVAIHNGLNGPFNQLFNCFIICLYYCQLTVNLFYSLKTTVHNFRG